MSCLEISAVLRLCNLKASPHGYASIHPATQIRTFVGSTPRPILGKVGAYRATAIAWLPDGLTELKWWVKGDVWKTW